MKHLKIAAFLGVILLIGFFPVFGQDSSSKIPIAVPDFTPLSQDISSEEVEIIQELLANALANEPIFEVLERKKITELSTEYAEQLSSSNFQNLEFFQQLSGARALLFGSVGILYGRTVITTRLVDLESGLVLFANNIYVEEALINEAIASLVNDIREKGFEMSQNPVEMDVSNQVKAKNFSEAKKLADIILRRKPDSPEIRRLYPAIIAGLADDYYRQAQGFLKKRHFDEAMARVNQALALKIDERYYSFREKVRIAEEDWNYKVAMREARRNEELARRAAGISSSFDSFEGWLDKLDIEGSHLGLVYAPLVDPDKLEVSLADGIWGAEMFWLKNANKDSDADTFVSQMFYAGLAAFYKPSANGAELSAAAYLSPLLAQGIKLGMFTLNTGLDGGAYFRYGGPAADDGESWSYAFGGGVLASFGIKALKSLGVYAAAKLDYLYFPNDQGRNGLYLRLSAGMSF